MRIVTRHGTSFSAHNSELSVVIGECSQLQNQAHLGDGAYGDVKGTNSSTAVKTIPKYFSFIQEHAILQLLHGCPGILKAKQFDHGKNMIHMERYDCNLREYLIASERDVVKLHAILSDVLKGLISMYLYGLVHGDIKPLNILIKYRNVDMPSAVICDFGFSGPDHFSKTRYCTAHYLESDFTATWHSDMFALAIVIVKMFGRSKALRAFRERNPTSEYVIANARRYLDDESLIALVTDMVNPDKEQRLSPIDVARRLYSDFDYPRVEPLHSNQIYRSSLNTHIVSPDTIEQIENIILTMGKNLSLNRVTKLSSALIIYMSTCNYEYDIDLLITAFLMLGSWLFGLDEGISLKAGLKIYEANTSKKIDEVILRGEFAKILISYPTLEYLYSE